MTGSQVVWSHPKPWSSSKAGPWPVLMNARLWPWMVRYWTSIGFGMRLLTGCVRVTVATMLSIETMNPARTWGEPDGGPLGSPHERRHRPGGPGPAAGGHRPAAAAVGRRAHHLHGHPHGARHAVVQADVGRGPVLD